MEWSEFNAIFEQTHVRGPYEIFHSEKAEEEENLSPRDLLKRFTFSVHDSYDGFVKTNKRYFENNNSNFVIDFDPCVISHDYSGLVRFWVEVKEAVPFNKRTGHLGNIPLNAILFELKWETEKKVHSQNTTPVLKIKLKGYINPEQWGGRGKLNLSRTGRPSYTGVNQIVRENFELTENNSAKEFCNYFYKGMRYFFL